MIVNGKNYPMWGQFIDIKHNLIGGILKHLSDSHPRIAEEEHSTVITDITLEPNGKESAMFTIVGKDFSEGCDVQYLGVTGGEPGWVTFSGWNGHLFAIKKPQKISDDE